MRTSEHTGTNPAARNARSDAAFPAATWAQHHSPAGTRRGRRRSAGGRGPTGRRRSRSSTDSSRRPTSPRPRTTSPTSSPYTSTSRRWCVARTTRGWWSRSVRRSGGRGAPAAGGHEHDVERSDLPCRAGQPHQQRPVQRAAVAVGSARRQLGRVDVGQHVGMPGERDDRARSGHQAGAPPPPRRRAGNDLPRHREDRRQRVRRPVTQGRGRGTGWRTCGPDRAARGRRRTRPTAGTDPSASPPAGRAACPSAVGRRSRP